MITHHLPLLPSPSQFFLAEKPKSEEEKKLANAPKKIASSDFRTILEMVYFALKGWMYAGRYSLSVCIPVSRAARPDAQATQRLLGGVREK